MNKKKIVLTEQVLQKKYALYRKNFRKNHINTNLKTQIRCTLFGKTANKKDPIKKYKHHPSNIWGQPSTGPITNEKQNQKQTEIWGQPSTGPSPNPKKNQTKHR